MSEVADETRCTHWPRSCTEVQAQTPTWFQFCDFCLYGPPEPPRREAGGSMTVEEMNERIAAPERERGERLREAVIAAVAEPSSVGASNG